MAPSVLSKQEGEGRMASSVLSNQEEQGHMDPSTLSKQEGEDRMAPSIDSYKEGQCHMAPYKISHKQAQSRIVPFIFSHKQVQGHLAPFAFSHKQMQGRLVPSILSQKQVQGHMAPSILSNKEEQDHMAHSVLSNKEGLGRMAHSILSHLERQSRRIVPETPRSRAKSGKTTLARSSSSGGKQKGLKRVSFYGLDPSSANKGDGLSTHSNADMQRMHLSTLRPSCRQMCLIKKRTVTTSNLTVNSPLRQTSGNLNMQLTNTAQLNVTDSSNVRRNNEQESSRSQVRGPPEKILSNKSQPSSRSKVGLDGIYWQMSKPGACRVRSRQPLQKVANVYEKPAGKLELNKTHTNIQRVEKSPESQSGNNSQVARTNADGLEKKKSISRRKAKLPMSVCNSKRTQKTEISNKIRKSSELSAFVRNESPLNHTEDFRQYIQLTRSDLHPFDAQRIRKDGSSVDPKKRTILQNDRVVNKATVYSTESTPAINSPAKEAHSSPKSRFSHKRRKLKKQRSTRTLENRQKTGSVREKTSHVEENISKGAEDRLNATSLQHKQVTDGLSGLTAAKQLQYKLVLGNLQAFRERSHPKTVDPPKTTNLESRLQRIINIVRSSSTASPPLLSNVALPCMQRSVPQNMASPNLNDETSKRADVDTVAGVIPKQTAHTDHSGDFCPVDEYPNVAAQLRNAAYMAYASTGRRAPLLGDVMEVVAYDKHSPMPCTRGAKNGFSEGVSAQKLKSFIAKNSAKIDSKNKLKPKLKKLGRLKRRCSKSAVTARSKRHNRVINITDNSSTKQMSSKTISKRRTRMNRMAMKESTRQQSKKARKPRCGISRRPRQRRGCKPIPGRDSAPVVSDKSRSLHAFSRRRARPSKRKYRKKPSTILGRVSHNAKHSDPHAAKCELIDKKHRTNQRGDSSNNKRQTMIFMFKRCRCLSKPPKVKRPRRKRFKSNRCRRCRRTNKQTDYFNRNNQRKNNKKDMTRMILPETKPCQAEGQVRGRNHVKSRLKRHLSPNMYLNTTANGDDDSDDSGGLSGTPRIRTVNVSRPSLLAESNSLFKPWENLLINEDR